MLLTLLFQSCIPSVPDVRPCCQGRFMLCQPNTRELWEYKLPKGSCPKKLSKNQFDCPIVQLVRGSKPLCHLFKSIALGRIRCFFSPKVHRLPNRSYIPLQNAVFKLLEGNQIEHEHLNSQSFFAKPVLLDPKQPLSALGSGAGAFVGL